MFAVPPATRYRFYKIVQIQQCTVISKNKTVHPAKMSNKHASTTSMSQYMFVFECQKQQDPLFQQIKSKSVKLQFIPYSPKEKAVNSKYLTSNHSLAATKTYSQHSASSLKPNKLSPNLNQYHNHTYQYKHQLQYILEKENVDNNTTTAVHDFFKAILIHESAAKPQTTS